MQDWTQLHFPSSLIEARDAICQRPLLKIAQQVWYTHKHKLVEAKVCTIMSSTKLAIVVIVQRLKQDTPWNRNLVRTNKEKSSFCERQDWALELIVSITIQFKLVIKDINNQQSST